MGDVTGRKPRVSRAFRRRMKKRFAVGDFVTWGYKICANKVVEVDASGLFVDDSLGGSRNPRFFVAWSDGPEIAAPEVRRV